MIGKVKMKSLVIILAFSFIFGLSAGTGAAEAPKKLKLKVVSALPPLFDTVYYFAENLQVASNGNITVKVYEPGKLIPALEIHEAVSGGLVNAGFTGAIYLARKIPAAQLFTAVPFGPSVTEYMAWFYMGNGMKLYQEMYDQAGLNLKAFPLAFLGMESGGWFRKPINSPEDIKGLKIRWPGLGGKVMTKLGASVAMIPGQRFCRLLKKGP